MHASLSHSYELHVWSACHATLACAMHAPANTTITADDHCCAHSPLGGAILFACGRQDLAAQSNAREHLPTEHLPKAVNALQVHTTTLAAACTAMAAACSAAPTGSTRASAGAGGLNTSLGQHHCTQRGRCSKRNNAQACSHQKPSNRQQQHT
jgi:hypothetical protein